MSDRDEFYAGWNNALMAAAAMCDKMRNDFDALCRQTYDPLDAGISSGAEKCAQEIRRMIKDF